MKLQGAMATILGNIGLSVTGANMVLFLFIYCSTAVYDSVASCCRKLFAAVMQTSERKHYKRILLPHFLSTLPTTALQPFLRLPYPAISLPHRLQEHPIYPTVHPSSISPTPTVHLNIYIYISSPNIPQPQCRPVILLRASPARRPSRPARVPVPVHATARMARLRAPRCPPSTPSGAVLVAASHIRCRM